MSKNMRTALVAGFISLIATSASLAADDLRVRLDWTSWGNHAPFHLAQKLGLFQKYDLNVQFDDGNGSVATVQIVGNGDYDVGHASLATMAIAREKGLPVKAVAGFFRQNDIGLLVDEASGITEPSDLKGKKLAFTAGSLETPFLDRFLASGGLTRDDVELINVSAPAKAGTYIAGQADGAFSSAPFLLPVVNLQRESRAIRFADYGLEFPSFGLFATEQTIANKPEALRRFASVVAGTWTYIFAGHEDEAVAAIMEARPQAKLNPEILRAQIETLKSFVQTEATQGQPVGVMAMEDWARAVAVLSESGQIPETADPAGFFTNDLIDLQIVVEVANGR